MSAHLDRSARGELNNGLFRLQLECSFAAVRNGARELRAYLLALGVVEKDLWACELAFVEGCNNIVQHAQTQSSEKLVVELSCDSTHVELRINDRTHGFDFPRETRLPSAEEESGRGIYLIRALMDEVNYIREPARNCLVLRKARTGI
jgi:serine/threonine-protein kinase RsbW